MAFTRDGSRLICTTDRGLAISFSTQTWQLVEQSQWSETSLVTMAISSDGQYIVTGDDGRNVRLGTVKQLKQLAVLGQHEARIKSVAFSPDGETVASGGDDKMIALWRVNRRKLIGRVGMHTSPVYAVAFSPDGRQLISGDHDRSVRLYARHATLWGFRLD
jgi:WD40 repeat protein